MATQRIRLKDADGNVLHPETTWEMVTNHPDQMRMGWVSGTLIGYAGTAKLYFNALDTKSYTGYGSLYINYNKKSNPLPILVLCTIKDVSSLEEGNVTVTITDSSLNVKTATFTNYTIRFGSPSKVFGFNMQLAYGSDFLKTWSAPFVFSTLSQFTNWVYRFPFLACSSTFWHVGKKYVDGEQLAVDWNKIEFNISMTGRDLNELKNSPIFEGCNVYYKTSPDATSYTKMTASDEGIIVGFVTYSPGYEFDRVIPLLENEKIYN